MATIKQGILGPFSGHCGPIIGYLRNGVPCIRSMPAHYRDRRSERQLQNRSRFTLVMKMMSLVRPAITQGFSHLSTDMTEMNLATRANYYTLVKGQGKHLLYDYSGLILSQGNVEPLTDLMTHTTGTTLTLHWNSQSVPGGSQDQITILLLNAHRMQMTFHPQAALRQQGTVTLSIPTGWNDEETYCYTMVQRASQWSDSALVGQLNGNTHTQKHPHVTQPISDPKPQPNQSITPSTAPIFTSHQTPVKLLFPSPPTRDKTTPPPPQNPPT